MTGRDLFGRLLKFGEIDADEDSVVTWIDLAQKEISLELPVIQSVISIGVTAGSTVSVPNGVFHLISATTDSGEYPLTAISVNSNSLTLAEAADEVTVVYAGPAPDYINIDGELTIHPSLHSPMLYLLISMYYDMEGEGDTEESGLAERYYQRWLYYKNLAMSTILESDYHSYARNPVETDDALPERSSRRMGDNFYE